MFKYPLVLSKFQVLVSMETSVDEDTFLVLVPRKNRRSPININVMSEQIM